MKVTDVMRRSVVTLRADDNLSVAEEVMTMGRIRHLPVVDDRKRVVGIVTQRDLYKAAISSVLGFSKTKARAWLGKIKVSDVMTKKVTTIDMAAGITDAVDKMLSKKFGCLPVTDKDGCLVGLLTESDCLRCFRDLLKAGAFKELLS
jgi:CBS-domain-containing membrane protein